MSELGPALLTLAGTTLGAGLTFLSVRSTRRSSERIAAQRIVEDRLQVARQLAADAYAVALDAVAWLHANNVEDSVLEPHAAMYDPLYQDSIRRLREARLSLHKVSALVGPGPLSAAAADVARELGVLDEAWDSARRWRKWMNISPKGKRHESLFGKSMERLARAREGLTGTDPWDLVEKEVALGGVTETSLFGRLRAAIGATATQ